MAIADKAKKSVNDSIEHFLTSLLKKIDNGEVFLTRSQILGALGAFTLISGILTLTLILPSMLESRLREEVALTKGSVRREFWSRLPFLCELRVCLFNVTNPDEISVGEKPILEEVGPFVYDYWQIKSKQIDDDQNDTVTYSINNTYFFNAKKSNNLLDSTELTLADFLTLGTPNAIMKDSASLLPLAAKAVNSVGNNPTSLFSRHAVKDYLFDGMTLDCEEVNDFFGLAYCKDMKDFYLKYRVWKGGEHQYVYSIFGALNRTDLYHGKIRIKRGTHNLSEVGNVVEYNDFKNMSIWKDDECDRFRGSEGTMFQPFLSEKKNKYLYVTNTFYCRTLTYKYESSVQYKGLKLLRYATSLGTDVETNDKDKCYCIAPDRCLKNGMYEIWRCFNNAFILSNPHFYLADKSYVNGVEGVKPNKDEHTIILDVDPLTGLAVRTHFRVQFNFMLMNLKKYKLLKDVQDAMLPVIWIDEVMTLPDFMIKRIKKIYRMILLMRISGYLMVVVGLILCGYALFLEYKVRSE